MNIEEIGNSTTAFWIKSLTGDELSRKKSLHLISFLQEYLQDSNILLFADNF